MAFVDVKVLWAAHFKALVSRKHFILKAISLHNVVFKLELMLLAWVYTIHWKTAHDHVDV